MNVLDLFSGIGGFSLGLERAGFRTVAFCEVEPYCRKVLAKHWPNVPCYDDVRTLTAERLRADGISVDLICGGFPCQDISLAGKGAGIEGSRSGLWREFARLIGELRPRYVIVENVSALLGRGLDVVLGDLAALGFDAQWNCIPASAVGAPHRRDRIWIVAYTGRPQERIESLGVSGFPLQTFVEPDREEKSLAYTASERSREARQLRREESEERSSGGCETVADADINARREGRPCNATQEQAWRNADRSGISSDNLADAVGERRARIGGGWQERTPECGKAVSNANRSRLAQRKGQDASGPQQILWPVFERNEWWKFEPDVGRVANGVPSRVDRLRCLGNAVVPQIPEIIGRAILQAEMMAA